MKKSFFLLFISLLCFNFTYAKTKQKKYNLVLSPKEFRIIWGTYLLERGNRKRLWKLLNETKVIKDNITLLNRKIDNLTTNQNEIKREIKILNKKLDNLTQNISKILSVFNELQKILKNSNYTSNLIPNYRLNDSFELKNVNLQKKGSSNKTFENLTLTKSKMGNIKKENEVTNILENKTKIQKENLNKNTKNKENTTLIYEIEGENQKSSLLDLTSDIENAIYYKGKGDIETYKKLIKEMIKKYPSYKSKLEKCLKDPDYIFQLYIEILNAETK